MSKLLSVVLPVYNEEEGIKKFVTALFSILDTDLGHLRTEVICVNDGSTDGSRPILLALGAQEPRLRVVSFSRNFGHQAALTAGLVRAKGDAVVTMDCDFQDPPEVLPQLVKAWEGGSKVIYARRRARADALLKKLTAGLFYRLIDRLSDVQIPRQVADYRLLDRVVVDNLLRLGEHSQYLRGMVAWLGFKSRFVDFDRPERLHGKTHYPLKKMLRFAVDGVVGFSLAPLKLAFWVGLLSIAISFCFLCYMFYDCFVRGVDYPLFKWLTVVLFGFMGAQFILMWILGEYIGRIYGDVRDRPLYVVEEISEASTES